MDEEQEGQVNKHYGMAYEEFQREPDDDSYLIRKMLDNPHERAIIIKIINES